MNQDDLQQFRQQLATWTEEHLATQRLPFQRLELCPRIITEKGRFVPDIVLWINRDSQLAGSMILLPTVVNTDVLDQAAVTSKALGLGHFTTWASREVCIWKVTSTSTEIICNFKLPPANKVQPEDFEITLERLLDELKILTITTAPASKDYPLYYFVNLCMRNLQELSPGLNDSARLTGGQNADDAWVQRAPIEKAWMSLWRILFLLWTKRLPPGLQPNRLEQVIHYAIADFHGSDDLKRQIALNPDEPPLTDSDAVRLHHLAGRMNQLDWPRSKESAVDLINLLLGEIALRYQLTVPLIPWEIEASTLWVNVEASDVSARHTILAPRPYLAGLAMQALLSERNHLTLAKNFDALDPAETHEQAIAKLLDDHIPDRKERESRLVMLRKAWPNRRFDTSHKSPAWLLDALFLTGITKTKLTIILPPGWHNAPGIHSLWEVLSDSFQLEKLSYLTEKEQLLLLAKTTSDTSMTKIHRDKFEFEIADCLNSAPGATQFWLNASQEIINYLRERALAATDIQWSEATRWGAYLYLHTQLGRYAWKLCTNEPLPDFVDIPEKIIQHGIPFPDERVLLDLGLSGALRDQQLPAAAALEKEFAAIWGTYPDPPSPAQADQTDERRSKAQRKGKLIFNRIINNVFVEGVPRFPEHYLMDTYKPDMVKFELEGPLKFAEEFFDTISLTAVQKDQTLEVSGKILADALILASWTGQDSVEFPTDHDILEKILVNYRRDLDHLWEKLTKECRRVEPHRQSALRMAKKIWQDQGLPPKNLF